MKAETSYTSTPLYNSRVISTYVKFIRNHYSYINMGDVLTYARMEPYQVEDEDHWFTQEQVDLFYERLERLTHNKDLAREAGRYAASPEAHGFLRIYVLGFVGPAKVYEMVGKAAPTITRSSVYEARRVGSNKLEITVTPKPGVQEKPFQCQNRMGYFEAVAMLFNYKLPTIKHTECMFEGGKCCRYLVAWSEMRSAYWQKMRNYATLLLSPLCLGLYLFSSPAAWLVSLVLSLLAVLFLTSHAAKLERKELSAAIDNLRISTDALFDKIDVNYNGALLVNEIGQALSRQRDIDGILGEIVQLLEKRLDYDRGTIMLANKERTRLIFHAGFGYLGAQLDLLKSTSFRLDRPASKGVFVVSFREQKPFLINDVDEIKADLSPRSLEFVKQMGAKSFICCPIVYVDDAIGVLAVDNVMTKRPLLQRDIDLLMGITPEIGIGIQNVMMTEGKERQFHSILQVLASSIDARDPLTAGHSERVTRYAVGISRELGLPRDYCEMIRVSSLLHDYGKIAIKDTILKKEGGLTPREYEEIKTHAEKSRKILEKIEFEGIYKEVPDAIGSHHEKYDGSGYPKGLRGDEIPLGARIIAVADVFEAITSKRHYRDPMPLEEALKLLNENKNLHFDAGIVDAFLRYYEKEGERADKRSPQPEAESREEG